MSVKRNQHFRSAELLVPLRKGSKGSLERHKSKVAKGTINRSIIARRDGTNEDREYMLHATKGYRSFRI